MNMRTPLIVALAALAVTGCKPPAPQTASPISNQPAITEHGKTDLAVGEGAAIAAGQTAVVHYTGWLYDASAPQGRARIWK